MQGNFRLFYLSLLLGAVSCHGKQPSGSQQTATVFGSSTPSQGDAPHPAFALQPGRSVVLPERLAQSVRAQCSRADFPDIDGTWTPSVDNVARMEAHLYRLNRHFESASRSRNGAESRLNVNDYHRQYVGILRGGQRFIYINALYNGNVDASWQSQAFNICDGGPAAWGCIYNPDADAFDAFRINGFG